MGLSAVCAQRCTEYEGCGDYVTRHRGGEMEIVYTGKGKDPGSRSSTVSWKLEESCWGVVIRLRWSNRGHLVNHLRMCIFELGFAGGGAWVQYCVIVLYTVVVIRKCWVLGIWFDESVVS